MSIIRKFRDSIQNDSVGGLFDDLHITGIEKQKDGKYAVGFDYYPAKLFTEAITLGYKEFDAVHKPPYFGALPENEVKSAFLSGVSQRKTDRTPENKRLAIPAGDDMGSEYQSFISEIHQLYAQSLQQIKKLLNRKFLVAGKPMPNSKVISGKRAGSPITIRANRRHVWLRFYRIPNKNIKQKGKLALSCIVKKDKTLHINLPAGYYKLIQADAGPSTKWYGTQYGFATSGSYRRWDDAIRIRPNLVYTLTTGISKGNASSSAVPWDQ